MRKGLAKFLLGAMGDRGRHPFGAGEIAQRTRPLQRMILAGEDNASVFQQDIRRETGRERRSRGRADVKIDLASDQFRLDGRIRRLDDANADIGIAFAKTAERFRQQADMRCNRQRRRQRAGTAAPGLGDLVPGVAGFVENDVGAAQQQLSDWRGDDTARMTLEQRHAELPLQFADAAGERRLRQVQLPRRRAQAAALGDGDDVLELGELHRAIYIRYRNAYFDIFSAAAASGTGSKVSPFNSRQKSMTPDPQVLIIGAGPVGLSAAIELGHRSIRCLLIERNDRVGYAPRAKTTNVRTREHLRRWGIADTLRAASPLGADYPTDIVFTTRLDGYALTRFENGLFCRPGKDPRYSEHGQWIPQYTVEEVLRAHAATLPAVTIKFSHELLSFTQDAASVHATIRDLKGGTTFNVACDYLIGADGSRSTVRDIIGAKMEGKRGLSRNYNVVFKAPGLAQAHGHGRGIMYWQVNRAMPSLLGPMDRGDTWFFMPTHVPQAMTQRDFADPAVIRKATGIDCDYSILSSDEWVANELIADRYREARVFLAGDACHLHPPFGGYGMNMGVADAVDLGWKIAAVLQGWGGPTLLDSYEPERRPVHQMVLDEAVANHAVLSNQLWQDGIEDAGEAGDNLRRAIGARIHAVKEREFRALGVVLGYRYGNSPIVIGGADEEPAGDAMNYVPSSAPGARAPHGWLADGRSLFDTFGAGYTLLVKSGEPAPSATTSDIPLRVVTLDEPEIAIHYPARFTLIRPDHHVAWRGDDWPGHGDTILQTAAGFSGAPSKVTERTQ